MRTIFSYLSPYKLRMTLGLLLKAAGTFAELFLPMIMAYMVDEIAPTRQVSLLIVWGVVMLICAIAALVGNVTANRMASRVARDTTERLRNDLFQKTLMLSARQTDEITVPSLVSRLSSDTYNVHNSIGMMQRLGVRAPILIIGGVAMTFSVEPVLALVLLAVVPFLTIVVILVSRKGIVLYTDLQRAVDGMVRKVRDDYTGIRVIKALSKTDYEYDSFGKINEQVVKCETKAGVTMGITNPVMNLLLNLGMTAVIVVGAYRVSSGHAMVGEIIAFTSYFTIILNAVISISRIFVNLSKGSASAKRIEKVLTCKDDLLPIESALNSDSYICFDNVTFGYGGESVLKEINFSVSKGQSLGIIGATGSGKSTLIALLMRFYDADKGNVYVDGKDVRSYEKSVLCDKFGVVLQNDFLMAASVRENIDFERGISDEAIAEAARCAKAESFINSFEEGFDRKLTARGSNFSGGQKQRLLISRALAGKPEILILDDSSSALDYKTDAQLRGAVVKSMPGTTIIMIAQRISSVKFADNILVLDQGRMVGFGSDEELMNSCEVYRRIYESQHGEEESV
ncbi:MAG: ABC transporter ATP-binding protein [Christensenellales bacterium]|jgi:ABC transporter transmembrane region